MTTAAPRRLRLEFVTEGVPVGQAALRMLGKGRGSTWANATVLRPWRDKLGTDALLAMDGQPVMTGPVALYCAFTLRRPNRPKFTLPIVRGLDLDHAQRAVGDALSGVVYNDDAQIVEWHATKRYAGDFGELKVPGVQVLIFEVPS